VLKANWFEKYGKREHLEDSF